MNHNTPAPRLPRSGAAMPAELYEVLSAMCREGRAAPAAAMAPDERGCTVLGAWVQQRLAQAQAATVQHAAGGCWGQLCWARAVPATVGLCLSSP